MPRAGLHRQAFLNQALVNLSRSLQAIGSGLRVLRDPLPTAMLDLAQSMGAAWFEAQLLDFDVHSNTGNWLYIAGRGTDPRGGRAFNLAKQAQDHDPDGRYQAMWR